jgi:hypothetical protein
VHKIAEEHDLFGAFSRGAGFEAREIILVGARGEPQPISPEHFGTAEVKVGHGEQAASGPKEATLGGKTKSFVTYLNVHR